MPRDFNDIDDRFLDLDFPSQPQYVRGYHDVPAFNDLMMRSSYEDAVGVLSDSEIREATEKIAARGGGASRAVVMIHNQKQEGSCVGNGFTGATETTFAKQFGKANAVKLSPISLYDRIGSSAGSGAAVSDGFEEAASRGIVPLDTPENKQRFSLVMPATGFSRRMPAGWEEAAQDFKVAEYHIVKSVPGIWSALARGEVVVVGRQGHCIYYVDPVIIRGSLAAKYANSWGEWGDAGGDFEHGFGYDTTNAVRQSAGWAVVIRSVVTPRFMLAA